MVFKLLNSSFTAFMEKSEMAFDKKSYSANKGLVTAPVDVLGMWLGGNEKILES